MAPARGPPLAGRRAAEARRLVQLEQRVNERSNHRALRQDQQHAQQQDHKDHRQHPPALVARKERNQFSRDAEPPLRNLNEPHTAIFLPKSGSGNRVPVSPGCPTAAARRPGSRAAWPNGLEHSPGNQLISGHGHVTPVEEHIPACPVERVGQIVKMRTLVSMNILVHLGNPASQVAKLLRLADLLLFAGQRLVAGVHHRLPEERIVETVLPAQSFDGVHIGEVVVDCIFRQALEFAVRNRPVSLVLGGFRRQRKVEFDRVALEQLVEPATAHASLTLKLIPDGFEVHVHVGFAGLVRDVRIVGAIVKDDQVRFARFALQRQHQLGDFLGADPSPLAEVADASRLARLFEHPRQLRRDRSPVWRSVAAHGRAAKHPDGELISRALRMIGPAETVRLDVYRLTVKRTAAPYRVRPVIVTVAQCLLLTRQRGRPTLPAIGCQLPLPGSLLKHRSPQDSQAHEGSQFDHCEQHYSEGNAREQVGQRSFDSRTTRVAGHLLAVVTHDLHESSETTIGGICLLPSETSTPYCRCAHSMSIFSSGWSSHWSGGFFIRNGSPKNFTASPKGRTRIAYMMVSNTRAWKLPIMCATFVQPAQKRFSAFQILVTSCLPIKDDFRSRGSVPTGFQSAASGTGLRATPSWDAIHS